MRRRARDAALDGSKPDDRWACTTYTHRIYTHNTHTHTHTHTHVGTEGRWARTTYTHRVYIHTYTIYLYIYLSIYLSIFLSFFLYTRWYRRPLGAYNTQRLLCVRVTCNLVLQSFRHIYVYISCTPRSRCWSGSSGWPGSPPSGYCRPPPPPAPPPAPPPGPALRRGLPPRIRVSSSQSESV
jgi:hypothetical protein